MEEKNRLQKISVEKPQEESKFPFFHILQKYLALIICVFFVMGALGTLLGYYSLKTEYTKECDIMLRLYINEGTGAVPSNTSLSKQYIPSVAGIIKSPAVIDLARETSGDASISRDRITVEYDVKSLIFTVSYTDYDQDLAATRLSTVVEATNELLREGNLIAARKVELIEMQSQFTTDETNKFPYFTLVSWVCGAVCGVLIAILCFALDNKLKSTSELEEIIGSSVLARVEK